MNNNTMHPSGSPLASGSLSILTSGDISPARVQQSGFVHGIGHSDINKSNDDHTESHAFDDNHNHYPQKPPVEKKRPFEESEFLFDDSIVPGPTKLLRQSANWWSADGVLGASVAIEQEGVSSASTLDEEPFDMNNPSPFLFSGTSGSFQQAPARRVSPFEPAMNESSDVVEPPSESKDNEGAIEEEKLWLFPRATKKLYPDLGLVHGSGEHTHAQGSKPLRRITILGEGHSLRTVTHNASDELSNAFTIRNTIALFGEKSSKSLLDSSSHHDVPAAFSAFAPWGAAAQQL